VYSGFSEMIRSAIGRKRAQAALPRGAAQCSDGVGLSPARVFGKVVSQPRRGLGGERLPPGSGDLSAGRCDLPSALS
jgi:hypothetical protein